MKITVFPPNQQGIGQFDGGKITEQKPIGFPGELSAVKRVGPLFYWAWFFAAEEGFIAPHPHQGFEIITYVMNGTAEHGDSLGTKSKITSGGAQVMQTGSGVYHSERFIGPDMEGFQIWFEPDLKEAVTRQPVYSEYRHEQFTIQEQNGAEIKEVIGEGSPIQLISAAKMWDIKLRDNGSCSHFLGEGKVLSALAVNGSGLCLSQEKESGKAEFHSKDFIVVSADADQTVTFKPDPGTSLRLILIEVPGEVSYPLYRKG